MATLLQGKIRHFYDLHYLTNDPECVDYIQSSAFYGHLQELFTHDQTEFDEPKGWTDRQISVSPLLQDFPALWQGLKSTYQAELRPLAFIEIPDESLIEESLMKIIERIQQ